MKINRRDLLKISLGSAGYAMLSQSLPSFAFAQAAPNEMPNLLLNLRVNGGWDTPMAMDSHHLDALKARGIDQSDYAYQQARSPMQKHKHTYLGSCMKPLLKNLDDITIVNGMMMIYENSVHETNRDYMSQGTLDRSAGFAPIQIAKELSKTKSHRVGFKLEYEAFVKAGHPSTDALLTLGKSNSSSDSLDFDEALMAKAKGDMDRQDQQSQVVRLAQSEKGPLNRLTATLPKMLETFGPLDQETEPLARGVSGLASGYLQMVCVDVIRDNTLDTHSNHVGGQTQNLTFAMARIAKVIEVLKATPYQLPVNGKILSLFDVTTVIVTDEFARTAWAEGGSGSSHNQKNNSCILFGRGIKGGQVLGRSEVFSRSQSQTGRSELHAIPFDYRSNKALSNEELKSLSLDPKELGKCVGDSCVDYIYPEMIWRSVAKIFGVEELPAMRKGLALDAILKS